MSFIVYFYAVLLKIRLARKISYIVLIRKIPRNFKDFQIITLINKKRHLFRCPSDTSFNKLTLFLLKIFSLKKYRFAWTACYRRIKKRKSEYSLWSDCQYCSWWDCARQRYFWEKLLKLLTDFQIMNKWNLLILTGSYRVHVLHKGTQTWYELQVRTVICTILKY